MPGRAVRARVRQTSSDPSAHLLRSSSLPPQVKQALADADVCVSLRPDWEKAHFRRGMALEDKGEDNDALAAFEAAHSTATGANNPEIAKKIKHLKAKVRPSSIHVPKTKPVAPSKADPSDKGGPKGDPEWLVTAKSPGQPIHVRIGAVNRVGNWLAAHLERVLKRPAGESEWFFEEREVVAFLDAGVFGSMLDVLTHTVVSIIAAEQGDGPDAAAAASQGADLAGTAAGVLHNLLHPSLRAWNTRKQHQALLATISQVFRMEGCPLNDPKGCPVNATDETKQFTALAAKVLGNAGALGVLTGHATLARARMQLLRAIVMRERNDGKTEEVTARMVESARALVVLSRCRAAGGVGETTDAAGEKITAPKPAWEPVVDAMLTDEGADAMRDEIAAVIDQHALLAGAFKKFGFEGSAGI